MKIYLILITILCCALMHMSAATGQNPQLNSIRLEFKDELLLEAGSIPGIDSTAAFKQIFFMSDNHLVVATWKDLFIIKNNTEAIRVGQTRPGKDYYDGVRFFSIDSQDNIYVNDAYSAFVFDKTGKFKKIIPILPVISHILPCLYVSPSGDLFSFFSYEQKNTVKYVLEQLNNDGKKIADIYSFDYKGAKIEERGFSVRFHEYMEGYYMVPVQNKEICFASNLEYRLYFYNLESRKIRSVPVAEQPVKITDAELDAFKNIFKESYSELFFPPHRPFFQGLLSDEKGRIFAVQTKDITDPDKKSRTLDVFDNSGKFLFRCRIPCLPLLIDKGRIFYSVSSKDKPSQVRVLQVLNWDELPY